MASTKPSGAKRKSSPPSRPGKWVAGGIALTALIIIVAVLRPEDPPTPDRGSLPAVGSPEAEPIGNQPVIEPQDKVFARYAGSESCRECHQAAYEDWKTSNHYFAERPVDPSLDAETFVPPHEYSHGTQTTIALATNGHFSVVSLGTNRSPIVRKVERIIGHDPLRQFLLPASGGRWQAFETAWDPQAKELFHLFGNEDRQPGEWGHWTGQGMNWNSMCASCHNTRLRKNYDESADSYHTAMAEMSVGCEACHGPMKAHGDWHRGNPDRPSEEPEPYRFSKTQIMDSCGTCHSRRYELTGDFQPGDSYFDHHALTIVDDTDLYYADGQVREEDYVFASFLSSRMHAAGVTCLDCHQPHTSRVLLPGNTLCMRCHSGGYPNSPVIDPQTHSFHQVGSSGSQCVNCHMPQTTYMQRHPRRDHGFTVPDPLLTIELGIPNACNRCHEDQDAAWASSAVERWYGSRMERPTRQRARLIASARRGEAAAADGLLAMLEGEETPYWQAVAAHLLLSWSDRPSIRRALVRATEHTNALVRLHALRGLTPLAENGSFPEVNEAVRRSLDDESRSVRYQAAWLGRPSLNMSSLAGQELQWALDLNADQPTGQMQKGALALSRGNPAEALRYYVRAVEGDPNSPPLRHELAVVYSMMGRPQEALTQMQEACRLDPRTAEYQYKLGLAWNEVGDLPQAVAAMERAVELDSTHGRAWYNLGLARNQQGRSDEAVTALFRAEALLSRDPGVPYALATVLAQAGRYAEARQAAQRALAIEPSHQPALSLLRTLP